MKKIFPLAFIPLLLAACGSGEVGAGGLKVTGDFSLSAK